MGEPVGASPTTSTVNSSSGQSETSLRSAVCSVSSIVRPHRVFTATHSVT